MSDFYLDSSAVAKRYLREVGTAWVRALTDPAAGNTITLSTITRAEVAAALAARHRAGDISRRERDDAVDLLLAAAGLPGLTFVAPDADLVAAARAEGLSADDPNLHP